jgi:hypothetical protein
MKAKAANPAPDSRQRLEAVLRSGADSDTLMAEIAVVCNADPGAAWETLALVDQFHRRGILSQDLYRTLKEQTEILALGRPNASQDRPAPPPALVSPAFAVPASDKADGVTDSAAQAFKLLEPPPEPVPPPPARSAPPAVGRVLRKRYVLEAPLDYGRGVVFQALDGFRADLPAEEQRVAVRFPAASTDAQREFYRLQSLAHPNVVRVHEFDRDGDLAFYTMELIRGSVLCDLLVEMPKLPLPMPDALAIIRDVGAALVHAHAHHVVHGHLDAHSVMITEAGEVRVLDFDWPPQSSADPQPSDDLQALAVLAYELLAGQHPFQRRSTITNHPSGLRVRRPAGLSRRQWRTLQYGLAWTRKKRGRTLASWLAGLELERASPHLPRLTQLLRLRPVPQWRTGARVALAAGVALAAVGLFAMVKPETLAAWLTAAHSSMTALWEDTQVAKPPSDTVITAAPAPVVAAPAPEVDTPPPARNPPRSVARPGLRERAIATEDEVPSPAAASPRDALAPPEALTAPANHGRLEFPYDTLSVAPGESVARVQVRRVNGTQGDVAFSWWTENGTARAGEDFALLNEQTEIILEGQDSATLLIPLVNDSTRDRTSTFFVNIEHATGGATLGANTHLTVTLRR